MDRADQMRDALKTTRRFGKEIEAMSATDRQAARTDLLPILESCTPVHDIQAFNEKCRKWIDAHQP